jgi:hypothetical protein
MCWIKAKSALGWCEFTVFTKPVIGHMQRTGTPMCGKWWIGYYGFGIQFIVHGMFQSVFQSYIKLGVMNIMQNHVHAA